MQVDCQAQCDLGGIWSYEGDVYAHNIEVKDNGGPGILACEEIYLYSVQSNNNKGPGIQAFIGSVTIKYLRVIGIDNQVIGNKGYGIVASEDEVNIETSIEVRDNAAMGIFAHGNIDINRHGLTQLTKINNNGKGTECWIILEWDGDLEQVDCQTQDLGGILSDDGSVSARIVEVNDNGGHGIWSEDSVVISRGEICRNQGYGIVVGGELDLQHVEVRGNTLGGIRSTQGEGSAKISPNRTGTDTLDIHGNPHAGRFNAKGSADGGGGHSTIVGSTIADNVGDGIRYEGETNPLINWNNIYNNTGYGLNNLDSSVEINARYNWWGNSSGPSGAGPGTGEEVSDYVDYRNWLVAPVGVVPCIEVEKSVWDPETEEWTEEIKADAGDVVRFQLFVHNDGVNCSLSNIVVTDTLPANLEYADNATHEPDAIVENKLTWNFAGPLEPCENITIEFDARVIECGDGVNVVNATAWNEELQYGVRAEDRAVVKVLPSIEVEKKVWDTGMEEWVEEISAEVGDNATFQLWIHQDGSCCSISDIVVEDTLPEGLEFVSAEPVPKEVVKNPDNTSMARWNLSITLEPCENTSIEMVANVTKGGELENEVSVNATGCGYEVSDTDEATVIAVGGVLEANFRFVPTEPRVCQEVRFFDETTGGYPPYSYEWDFNNNTIVDSTEANPTWNYTEPGTYAVTLKVNDTEGNTDTTEKIITVHIPPNITAFAPPSPVNDTVCTWRTFNISVNQTVNVSWYLNGSFLFTNASIREASCTRHAEVVGEHNVSAKAENANGTDIQSWVWNVTAAPVSVLEINKTGVPDPVSPGGALNYTIQVNNAGNANATNVTVTETYDANVTFVTSVPAPSLGNDTWQFPTLNVSKTRWINISVNVNASVLNGTVLHNIVNVTCDEGVSDSDTADTTVLFKELNCTCGDICVNTTGWWRDGGAFNTSGTPIQAAIDNATAGDVICVKDGTYNENVDVNKRLTIRSENGAASTSVRAASLNDYVFEITADYVNISGFHVTGAIWADRDSAGFYLRHADHCNVSDNTASNNYHGIFLNYSSDNTLVNNSALDNSGYGIYLSHSSDNTLVNNTANSKERHGIELSSSSNNNLVNNTMTGNRYNFGVSGSTLSHFIQDIDTSNTVDGKPIYYWVDQQNRAIPNDAGYVGVVNSTNITVRDLTLTKNGEGVLFAYTDDSIILTL